MCTLIIMRHVFPDHPWSSHLIGMSGPDGHLIRQLGTRREENVSMRPKIWCGEDMARCFRTWIVCGHHQSRRDTASIRLCFARPTRDGCASGAKRTRCSINVATAFIEHRYNGFHLVIVDVRDAFLCVGYEHRVEVERMDDGISVSPDMARPFPCSAYRGN